MENLVQNIFFSELILLTIRLITFYFTYFSFCNRWKTNLQLLLFLILVQQRRPIKSHSFHTVSTHIWKRKRRTHHPYMKKRTEKEKYVPHPYTKRKNCHVHAESIKFFIIFFFLLSFFIEMIIKILLFSFFFFFG
jgi:hypothetical protein